MAKITEIEPCGSCTQEHRWRRCEINRRLRQQEFPTVDSVLRALRDTFVEVVRWEKDRCLELDCPFYVKRGNAAGS